jgi:hypothetical protein
MRHRAACEGNRCFGKQSRLHIVFVAARIVTARRIDSARMPATGFRTADDGIAKSPYFSGSKCTFIGEQGTTEISASSGETAFLKIVTHV